MRHEIDENGFDVYTTRNQREADLLIDVIQDLINEGIITNFEDYLTEAQIFQLQQEQGEMAVMEYDNEYVILDDEEEDGFFNLYFTQQGSNIVLREFESRNVVGGRNKIC